MPLIVDFQAVKKDKNFILKEIAIVDTDNLIYFHGIVKNSVAFTSLSEQDRRTAIWLEKNFHGLHFFSGNLLYEDVIPILQSLDDVIYCKGFEKQKYLSTWVKDVRNLEKAPCLNKLSDIGIRCLMHEENNFVCALNQALNLTFWYNEHGGA